MRKDYETITKEEIEEMFNNHSDFSTYVLDFSKNYGISVEETLQQAIVKERAIDYLTRY